MKLLSICEDQAREFWHIAEGTRVFKGGYFDSASIIYEISKDETLSVKGSSFVLTKHFDVRTRYTFLDYCEGHTATIVPACATEQELEIAFKNTKGTLILVEESHDDFLAFFAVVK